MNYKKLILVMTAFLVGILSVSAVENAKFKKAVNSKRKDQKLCSGKNVSFEFDAREKFVKEQEALVKAPPGKKYIGDHKKGRELFADSKRGNCYACHCGESSEMSCGDIGPSLKDFAKSEMDPDFVYQRVYNSWSIMPCSVMPRFGVHGELNPSEIADIVGYLLDKDSPLNKQ